MRKFAKYLYIFFSFCFVFYALLSIPSFPPPARDFLQSEEPADVETPLRKAYFTNLTRAEVIEHYNQVYKNKFFGFSFPNVRLNYPPEEAQTIIRDQTRSTFLEELVHPLRSSLYINGFEPKEEKDKIIVNGQDWRQKVTVRYVPSPAPARVIVALIIIAFVPLLTNMLVRLAKDYYSLLSKNIVKK
ncbi:MAG: hypothetical protein NZM26_00515, partial [Patescibacteria group bacterium]|nr:hypothetical protein [Patescibacteria group bacterium]